MFQAPAANLQVEIHPVTREETSPPHQEETFCQPRVHRLSLESDDFYDSTDDSSFTGGMQKMNIDEGNLFYCRNEYMDFVCFFRNQSL